MQGLGLIFGRRVRCFRALLTSKSDNVDPDIVGGTPQRPITLLLEAESTEENVTAAFRSMTKANVMGLDELPLGLLCIG